MKSAVLIIVFTLLALLVLYFMEAFILWVSKQIIELRKSGKKG